MTYGFLGLGNMATAIIGGMRGASAYEKATIRGFDPDGEKCEMLSRTLGVEIATEEKEIFRGADMVVLAVKPQMLPTLLPSLKESVEAGCTVVTIAAGKELSFYEDILGEGTAVVRVMPNLCAKVGGAASSVCGGKYASEEQVEAVCHLFSTVGQVFRLPEAQFSLFTALSGSSVAFAFLYMDAIAQAGVDRGIDVEEAVKISAAVAAGAAKMVAESGIPPRTLAKMVCSPGGTTIEGVASLEKDDFTGAVDRAVEAVIQKDKKMR